MIQIVLLSKAICILKYYNRAIEINSNQMPIIAELVAQNKWRYHARGYAFALGNIISICRLPIMNIHSLFMLVEVAQKSVIECLLDDKSSSVHYSNDGWLIIDVLERHQ